MRRSPLYIICVLLLMAGFISGCTGCNKSKKINDRVTIWRNDKIPYGTAYAYQNLQRIFPEATVINNKRSPDPYRHKNVKDIFENTSYNSHKTCYIAISAKVLPDDKELDALFAMVSRGEQVFISSSYIGDNLLDTLLLKPSFYSGEYNDHDSLTVQVANPVSGVSSSFTYPGKAQDNYFTSIDSTTTTVLGKDAGGRANFIKISYESGGAFYIHMAPLALTNFFLLHKDNKSYYDQVLSYLPKDAQVIRWDDYFRNSDGSGRDRGGRGGKSALGWWIGQSALAWGTWLLLALLLLIYLFESKRKQRIIPVIAPLNNASLDFVKTIGRMYFQRKDNKDLAGKMMAHFLGHVRNRYSIRSSVMDDDFIQRLAYKSGYDQQAIQALVYDLHYAQAQPQITDHELLELNHKLETFYQFA